MDTLDKLITAIDKIYLDRMMDFNCEGEFIYIDDNTRGRQHFIIAIQLLEQAKANIELCKTYYTNKGE